MTKRFLMILVLGLLLSSNAFAGNYSFLESTKKVINASGGHVKKWGNPSIKKIRRIADGQCKAFNSGSKAINLEQIHRGGFGKSPEYSYWHYDCEGQTQSQASANNQNITFTIKDKKEQCAAIGFKPNTEKFADCVLRLVELDVKQQTTNIISSSQNSGNQQLAKQLERQNNMQQTQFLFKLGQQLLTPQAPASMPTTNTCTIRPLGTNMTTINCF